MIPQPLDEYFITFAKLCRSDIVCTVQRNQLYKKTQQDALFMYLFYNICTTLHLSNDYFVHLQEFMIYCICSYSKS